jgi:epoxyqueuosine reductase
VCPLNHGKWEPAEAFPQLNEIASELVLERLFRMTQSSYEQIIQPRYWYISKENLWIWKSNILRAMANSEEVRYHHLIKEALNDPNESVRQMAHWAEQTIG